MNTTVERIRKHFRKRLSHNFAVPRYVYLVHSWWDGNQLEAGVMTCMTMFCDTAERIAAERRAEMLDWQLRHHNYVHCTVVWALRYEENPDYLMWDLRTVTEPNTSPRAASAVLSDDDDDEDDEEEELLATMVIWKVPWRSSDYGECRISQGYEEAGHNTARSGRSERALVAGQRGSGYTRNRDRTRP